MIKDEAARLDCSLSGVLRECLLRSLPDLAATPVDAPAVAAMKKSPLRNPIRLAALGANLALAESDDPAQRELATTPMGTEARTFYLPRSVYAAFDAEGDRLKLSSDEILMWAWQQNRGRLRTVSSLDE